MKVAIHQPQYLPWLGYADKIDSADVFVLLDTVQFKKHEWQNRNRIRTKDEWQWLTVPVIDRFPERIDRVEINSRTDWQRKHCQALRLHYAKAQFWEPVGPDLLGLIERPWSRLAELNCAVLDLLCRYLGITTPRILASTLIAHEEPTERLIDLCRAVGGSTYLAGQGGVNYMDLDRFRDSGLLMEVQAYRHPSYSQRYQPFVSHLSVVDLLFNCGPKSLEILRSGRNWERAEFLTDYSRRDAETRR
ncbi:MAG: WbqC family protein [candidate division NC10 bacterium]|nr:WbqC family protein [candidate division NC10 bacterium]